MYLVVYICFAVLLKRSKLKRTLLFSMTTPFLLVVLVYSSLLFINAVPIKSTDLSKININGYYGHQKIPDDVIQSDFKKMKHKAYEHAGHTYDLFFLHLDDTLQIKIYNGGEDKGKIYSITAYASDAGYVNSIDNLEIGKSSFDQVVNKFGTNYRNVYYNEIYSKIIVYEDKGNKISLRLSFTDNQLRAVILQSL
jgi:hypothetical protein